MDTCSASHKKVRGGLRSRRVHVDVHSPFAGPVKKPDTIKPKSKKAKLNPDHDRLIVTPAKTSQLDQTIQRDTDVNKITKASDAGKVISVKSKRNALSKPANENDGCGSKTSTKEPENRKSESEIEGELNELLADVMDENQSEIAYSASDHRNMNDHTQHKAEASSNGENHQNGNDNRSETSSIGDFGENRDDVDSIDDAKDLESNDGQDNCLEDVLNEVNKDIGALYSKTNKIEADLKEIKQILLTRPSQHCIRTISSRFKQKSSTSLLPKFPLKKKSAVRKMDANADDDDNEEYKDQLVMKLASFGGDTVNELVINIFKRLFSTKLKTKYCWKGTTRGKHAFKRLTGIREAIWSAVKIHFKDCTESTVNKEFKLRLNQAQKDYDRELLKEQNGIEY